MAFGERIKKPSEMMLDLQDGKLSLDDAPDWLRSWASHSIYIQAMEVVDGATLDERRDILSKVSPGLRKQIEEKAMEIFMERRRKKS